MFSALFALLSGKTNSVLVVVAGALLLLSGVLYLEKRSNESTILGLTGEIARCRQAIEQYQGVKNDLEGQIDVLIRQCEGLKHHEETKPKPMDPSSSIDDLLREFNRVRPPTKGTGTASTNTTSKEGTGHSSGPTKD